KQAVALDPENYIPFTLAEIEKISHDTRRFRFSLPSPTHVLGLPIGQHISLRFEEAATGKVVTRSYTPTSSDEDLGYVDLVIKVYFPNVEPKFPDGGQMSMHLERRKIGDTVDMRGPKGNLTYCGNGVFSIKRRDDRKVTKLGMIAGGTGITPMLQIIAAIMREGEGLEMELSLIFANKTEEDILLRDSIEDMASKHKNFNFHYTLDKPPKTGWTYSSGFVTKEIVGTNLPAPGPETLILMCGPPPMIKFACLPALGELGFSEDMHFSF
ncbi:unnamed protein product, partial [Choristocarpus tenellus]